MASDFAMFRRLGRQVKPGGYDMQWLVEDFETAIRSELDCENEARNCEIASRLLAGRGGAKCPKVVWELTRTDVLVMEYVPGLIRLTEPEVLTANGLDLVECGQQVSDALMELALVHGHVHGDPHAGNIYVVGERAGRLQRRIRPCVVVLDHGLYHHIDDTLRRDVCSLFLACIGRHRRDITRLSHKCAGPLGRFFPLLLSPWFVLGTSLSAEDVRAARNNKLPPSVSAKDVGDAMTSLHVMGGNMLGVLHSFGYVRGLLNAVNFGERRRLKSVARLSVIGLLPPPIAHQVLRRGDSALPLAWRWKLWKARANVDITAALLYVLSTATTEEFDVTKTPAVVVHLAAALLAAGRWSSMKALNEAMVAVYFFFCPDDYVAETREGAGGVEAEGQETAVGSSTEASQRHTRQQAESQAELAGASPGGEGASGSECEEGRVGAVSLLQKVKGLGGGVLQRAGSLTSSVTSSMASRYRDRVGAASVGSDTSSMVVGDNPERVRNGGRASSFDEAGGGSAPSLMGSVISRADSEAWYQGGVAAAHLPGVESPVLDAAGSAQASPRNTIYSMFSPVGSVEDLPGLDERSATEPLASGARARAGWDGEGEGGEGASSLVERQWGLGKMVWKVASSAVERVRQMALFACVLLLRLWLCLQPSLFRSLCRFPSLCCAVVRTLLTHDGIAARTIGAAVVRGGGCGGRNGAAVAAQGPAPHGLASCQRIWLH